MLLNHSFYLLLRQLSLFFGRSVVCCCLAARHLSITWTWPFSRWRRRRLTNFRRSVWVFWAFTVFVSFFGGRRRCSGVDCISRRRSSGFTLFGPLFLPTSFLAALPGSILVALVTFVAILIILVVFTVLQVFALFGGNCLSVLGLFVSRRFVAFICGWSSIIRIFCRCRWVWAILWRLRSIYRLSWTVLQKKLIQYFSCTAG